MRKLGSSRNLVRPWREMEKDASDLYDLICLAEEGKDASLAGELNVELEKLVSRFERLENQLLLSGEYDARNAMLAIHAGAGGTESQDWANMLLRMY